MDKSFNDQELSDIMKEIEALEDDFTASGEKTTDPVMEELEGLTDKEKPFTTPGVVSLDSKRAAPLSQVNSAPASMSFKVQGNLELSLEFDIGGKVVALQVSEAGLTIEMDGGMKFTVPVNEKSALKKAA